MSRRRRWYETHPSAFVAACCKCLCMLLHSNQPNSHDELTMEWISLLLTQSMCMVDLSLLHMECTPEEKSHRCTEQC